MARASKLKVYRTPIGFHDAYVAAPNQKAALKAWGADANLFSRGVAEIVTDAALTAEPLAAPGVVVKRLRGTAAEHLAALPPDKPTPSQAKEAPSGRRKPRPRPDRSALDAAEQALDTAHERLDEAIETLRRREVELQRQRHQAEQRRDVEIATLEDAIAEERARYDRAMRAWRAQG